MAKIILDSMDLEMLLVELIKQVKLINQKLDVITKSEKFYQNNQTHSNKSANDSKLTSDVLALLALPGALRKTVIALYKLEEATAQELAKETNRLRAVESSSANQLTRMGYVKKKRVGNKIYFYIEPKLEEIN